MNFDETNYDKVSVDIFKKLEGIKVIVFDFDDTLYKYLPWGDGYNKAFMERARKIFAELSDKQFEEMLKKNNFVENYRLSENFAKVLLNEKGSTDKLVEMLENFNFATDWSKAKTFPQKVIKKLSQKYDLYIVSNSSKSNIEYICKNINFDLTPFKEILSNKFDKRDLSKMFRLKEVCKEQNVKPEEVLMVGDSVEYDLLPAKKIGMKTLLIRD